MKTSEFVMVSISVMLILSCKKQYGIENDTLALVGGSVLNFENYGNTESDLHNAVVLIEGGTITAVGKSSEVEIPKNAKIIDVSGKYLVPGLIDGFATINTQGYANAFLYMGVTTIVGVEESRRGPIFWNADPSPEIVRFSKYYGDVWSEEKQKVVRWHTRDETEKFIDSVAANGTKVLLVHYGVKPEQLRTIVDKCKEHRIVTIGELGYSKVAEAIEAGVKSFVHISRYTIDIVPEEIKKGYKDEPFGAPRIRAYRYFEDFDAESDSLLANHAKLIGNSDAALIPTHSLWYPSYPFARNPWKYPVARLIEVDSIHMPVSKETGKWTILKNNEPWDTLIWSEKLAQNLLKIEKKYVRNDTKYLTGSGTDAFGTMPGISLHTEMEMLHRAGLTNREVIAAATTNFCKIYGWEKLGQIKKGSEADILVLSQNPLESLEYLDQIEFLILDGEILDRKGLLSIKK